MRHRQATLDGDGSCILFGPVREVIITRLLFSPLPNDDGSGEPRLENEHVTSSNYQRKGGSKEKIKVGKGTKKIAQKI